MRESIMDMDLSERIREIQKEEGRVNHGPINIAGPAGNPTQPGYADEHRSGVVVSGPNAYCSDCGAKHGLGHFISCKQAQLTDDYYCGFKFEVVYRPDYKCDMMYAANGQLDVGVLAPTKAEQEAAKRAIKEKIDELMASQGAPTPAP